jgi:hypothetical protein
MPLESYWCKQMMYHCDFTRSQWTCLASYALEAASGLAYGFGSLPGLASHWEDSSALPGSCNASSSSTLPIPPYQ